MQNTSPKNYIIFSSIDWSTHKQLHHELTNFLVSKGNRVLFVENTGVRYLKFKDAKRVWSRVKHYYKSIGGFKEVSENITIFSPLFIPMPYNWFATKINSFFISNAIQNWIKISNYQKPIVITFLPTPLTQSVIKNLSPRLLIYYCADNMSASSSSAKYLEKWEKKLLKESELVFFTSETIGDNIKKISNNNYFSPNGVDFKKFNNALFDKKFKLNDLPKKTGPILGYVGAIRSIIDKELLINIAERLPNVQILLIGPKIDNFDEFKRYTNIFFLGEKKHDEIPFYVKEFDIGLIPYIKNNFTDSIYPVKLNEYLAVGIPVISTNLREIKKFNEKNKNCIEISENNNDFIEKIKKTVEEKDQKKKELRINIARNNSWESCLVKVEDVLEKNLDSYKNYNISWKKNLKKYYYSKKIQLIKFFAIFSLVFSFLVFPPWIQIFANNIIERDKASVSDTMLVMAGYGDTEYNNLNYRKRVLDAITYYKNGFSKKIIITGRFDKFREVDIMQPLLVQENIPKDVIYKIKEDYPSTYENIVSLKNLIKKEKIKSVILITAPHHSKRAKLVWEKNIPNTRVFAVSVLDTPSKKLLWNSNKDFIKDIKIIAYEYLAIIYYKFKGWI